MNSSSVSNYLVQVLMMLAPQAPGLLIFFVGFILALVFWRRCPSAYLLAVVGCITLIASSIAYALVTASVLMGPSPLRGAELSRIMSVLSITTGVARSIGYGFLVAAIFAGRKPVARGFPVDGVEPVPPSNVG